MDGSVLLERAMFGAATFGLAMGLLGVLLGLRAILRKPSGPYLSEFNAIAMSTGAILWGLPYLASKETRGEVEMLGTLGLGLFLASCGTSIALHRLKAPKVPSTRD